MLRALVDVLIPSEYRAIRGMQRQWKVWREYDARRAAGERIPNALLTPEAVQELHPDIKFGRRPSLTGFVLQLILIAATTAGLYSTFRAGTTPAAVIPQDLAILMGVTFTLAQLWFMCHSDRSLRLFQIRAMRRRFGPRAERARRGFSLRRAPLWPIGLFAGLITYAALVAPVAGATWAPPWLATAGAALGHGRVAPIVLFPLALEWLRRRFSARRPGMLGA